MSHTLLLILISYLLLINLITFITYGIDKRKAKKNRWRVPEATLILLAAIGGSIGALLGMHAFHHKTQKAKFAIGVPLILILQIALTIFIAIKLH